MSFNNNFYKQIWEQSWEARIGAFQNFNHEIKQNQASGPSYAPRENPNTGEAGGSQVFTRINSGFLADQIIKDQR